MSWGRAILPWIIALAAALGWWGVRDRVVGSDAATGPRPFLADPPSPESIERIELRRGAEPPMEFRREPDGWWMVAPFRHPMDPFSMRQVAVALAGTERYRSLPADGGAEGRAALGLDPPRATLRLEGGGRIEEISLGRRGLAGRAYLERAGEPPAVTDAKLHERILEMEPKEWRQRRLFPFAEAGSDAVAAIAWDRAGQRIRLEREGKNWQVVAPLRARADRPRVEDLLAAIGRVESEGFLFDTPADLAPFGLAEPVASVTLEPADGTPPRRVLVGSPVGLSASARHAAVEGVPSVVRLGAPAQATLFPPLEVLVDPVASGVRPDDVKRIEIRTKTGRLELLRGDDGWTLTVSDADGTPRSATPADRAATGRLLASLTRERAPELRIAEFPAELEVATIILFGFDQAPRDIVRVARDPDTGRFALENGDGVLRIHPAALPLALEARSLAAP